MRILGIDPGYGRMGYGVIEGQKSEWKYIAHGCIETSSKLSLIARLLEIHSSVATLIKKYRPDRAAVESLFFATNAKTAMQVGQARGVILLALAAAKLPIDEFTPLQVKQAITGYGKADKIQMQRMITISLKLPASPAGGPKKPIQDDAADALSIALTSGLCWRTMYSSP